jgi:hypothetical protein
VKILPRLDWADDAYCIGLPLSLFFGSESRPMTSALIQQGRSVCELCSVKRDCLIDALRIDERNGIRGGFLGNERHNALTEYGTVEAVVSAYDEGTLTIRRRSEHQTGDEVEAAS